jgi:hypothetical protein
MLKIPSMQNNLKKCLIPLNKIKATVLKMISRSLLVVEKHVVVLLRILCGDFTLNLD